VADYFGGSIIKITPGGVQTTFASGLGGPNFMSFDGAGNLFVANYGSGSVTKITPGGVQSTFASGLSYVSGVAVNSTGNVFVSVGTGNIFEYTPGRGGQSVCGRFRQWQHL
jgi:sugar lactone lactonase YvrE